MKPRTIGNSRQKKNKWQLADDHGLLDDASRPAKVEYTI